MLIADRIRAIREAKKTLPGRHLTAYWIAALLCESVRGMRSKLKYRKQMLGTPSKEDVPTPR